jgi:hypothetical protein
MLDVALTFLAHEANAYLLSRTRPQGDGDGQVVRLGRLVDDTGKWALEEERVGVALVNVEEERTLKGQLPETALVNGRQVVLEPTLRLELHVLFAARFKQYDQALHHLAHVITFFQAHPSFTPERHPTLDPRLHKLTAELLSLGYEQLNQLWAFLGAKHLPSVVYRIRLVALQDLEPSAIQRPVTSLVTDLRVR